jgi:hypothetical protein
VEEGGSADWALAQKVKPPLRVWLISYFLALLVDCKIPLLIANPLFYNVRHGTKNWMELTVAAWLYELRDYCVHG